jgi:hypothetical protein
MCFVKLDLVKDFIMALKGNRKVALSEAGAKLVAQVGEHVQGGGAGEDVAGDVLVEGEEGVFHGWGALVKGK